jgi:hypothetical protein
MAKKWGGDDAKKAGGGGDAKKVGGGGWEGRPFPRSSRGAPPGIGTGK